MKVDEYLLSFVLEILLVLQLLLLQGRQEFVVSKVFLERIFLGNFSWICHTFFFVTFCLPFLYGLQIFFVYVNIFLEFYDVVSLVTCNLRPKGGASKPQLELKSCVSTLITHAFKRKL